MPPLEQSDPISERARQAVADYVRLFVDLNPRVMAEQLEPVSQRLGELSWETVPAFVEVLHHAHRRARVVAAWYLLKVDDERPGKLAPRVAQSAALVIRKALRHPKATVRLFPLSFLGAGGCVPVSLVPKLHHALADPDQRVQTFAAAALCQVLIAPGSSARLMGNSLGRMLAILRTAIADDAAAEAPELAAVAANALAQLGVQDTAVDRLAAVLRTVSPGNRMAVAQLIGQAATENRQGLTALTELLDDRAVLPVIRQALAKAIVDCGKDVAGAVARAEKAHRAGDWAVFMGTVEGLVSKKVCPHDFPRAVVDLLTALLLTDEIDAPGTAAFLLAQHPSAARQAVPVLVERMGREANEDVLEAMMGALAAAGAEAVPPLIAMVRTRDMTRLGQATAALVKIGSHAVADISSVLLADTDERVRIGGLLLLREIGPDAQAAWPRLLEMRENASSQTREAITLALAAFGSTEPAIVAALLDDLSSPDANRVFWASRGLMRLGSAVRPALEARLRSAEPPARGRIALVLQQIASADNQVGEVLLAIKRKRLQTFASLGRLLGDAEKSWREMAPHLSKPGSQAAWSPSGLAKAVAELGADLARLTGAAEPIPLTTHRPHRPGRLSPAGRMWHARILAFLEPKATGNQPDV